MRHLLTLISVAALLAGTAIGLRALIKSPTFQIVGEAVSRVKTTEPVIALTFDDGPSKRHTADLLAALDAAGVKATFFLNGAAIEAAPEDARAIVDAGHEIGNHSFAHDRLILMSRARIRDDLARTDAAIRATGYTGPIPFRPPYGNKFVNLPRVLWEKKRPSVTWSLAPEMLEGDLAENTVARARSGDIVLLHGMFPVNEKTREALPAILEGLTGRGFRFVAVSELLALR